MIFELMNDVIEIDLRKYILLLFKYWWQIIIFTIALAIISFVITTLIPITYRATALVAVTQPSYQLNFDPKIQTINVQPANSVYLDLATSDDIIKQVYDQWSERPESVKNLETFRNNIIKVSSGSDPSIIRLSVTTRNPEQSAKLANFWANALITRANTVYFKKDQQLTFLEDQLIMAKKDLDQAEQALVEFQAQNQLQILTNQLSSLLQYQKDYLGIQRNITYLNQSLQGLRAQIDSNSEDQATIADQLSALLLQFQAFNNQTNDNINTIPLQIQFTDPVIFGNLDGRAQITILDNLAEIIQENDAQIVDELKTLDPQILGLQEFVQLYKTNQDQLENTRDIAMETYTTLAQSVDQTRISDQDPSYRLQLASTALPPTEPLSRNRAINTILAGFAGVIIAVVAILIREWWYGQAMSEVK